MEDEGFKFVDVAKMAEDRQVHVRTIKRLAKDDPDFPELSLIGNRLYARARAWEEYKIKTFERGLSARRTAAFPPEHSATAKDRKVSA